MLCTCSWPVSNRLSASWPVVEVDGELALGDCNGGGLVHKVSLWGQGRSCVEAINSSWAELVSSLLNIHN